MNAATNFIPQDAACERIIRVREVVARVGLHRATIDRKVKAGEFPASIALGANSRGWYESEINAWIANPTGWRKAA